MRFDDLIRERGPLTVAAFMELALYDSEFGYYARAGQRSGRAGDFFTSVDVGPLFGQLLELQLAEMWRLLNPNVQRPDSTFDLVEAGAGNGRLSADILRAARSRDADFYGAVRLHLVEASAAARAAQPATLGDLNERLAGSSDALPASFEGVLVANELLDALPVHQVVMREDGLREVYVTGSDLDSRSDPVLNSRSDPVLNSRSDPVLNSRSDPVLDSRSDPEARLRLVEGPLSTPALAGYLERLGVSLEPGWRVEINLRAIEWIRDAARRLARGFIILIDYGHEARELYSLSHAAGTLTTYARHRSAGPEADGAPPWLQNPGGHDITAHVDFTSVRAAAEAEGLTTLGLLDQTYFVLGLLPALPDPDAAIRNPQAKTLLMPGGLGSTHKVLILGKGVGAPALRSLSFKVRAT